MSITLNETMEREIFEQLQLKYCIEDIKDHLKDFLEEENSKELTEKAEKLDESDYRYMAQYYLDNHDCNIADNDQYRNIIRDYIKFVWIL